SAASRLDAELARGLTEPVQLQNMLSAMVEVYGARADLREVHLEFISELRKPVLVQGIESQLAQAFRNLLDNAISFSPDGGKVSISLDNRDEFAEILVEDEGPGLPLGSIDSVFKRFYSDRPAGEKFGDHSGLGLSIARQILEAHGGSVVASNRASRDNEKTTVSGACFVVRIPLAAG
ncbi:MAG TPA: ATP-binding protein, partial [Alphaproteobacteria bacterium]|nr:ATP-binding protein [Alphaproteobacteria bacterium]